MNFEIRGVKEKYARSAKWRSEKASSGHIELSDKIKELVSSGEDEEAKLCMTKLYNRVYAFRKARGIEFGKDEFITEFLNPELEDLFNSIEYKKPKKEKEDPLMGIAPSTLKATYDIAGIEILTFLLVVAGRNPLLQSPS